MKNLKLIPFMMALICSAFGAYADENTQSTQAQGQAQDEMADEQVSEALITLIKTGLVRVENGQVVLKNPSVLDQLSKNGRLKVESAVHSAVCF